MKADFDEWVDEDEQSGMAEVDFSSFSDVGDEVEALSDAEYARRAENVASCLASAQRIVEQLYSDECPDVPALTGAALEQLDSSAASWSKVNPIARTMMLRMLAGVVQRNQKKASDRPRPFAPELILDYQDTFRVVKRRDADADMRPLKFHEDSESARAFRQRFSSPGTPFSDEEQEDLLRNIVEGLHLGAHIRHKAPANYESLLDPTLKDGWGTTVENAFPRTLFGELEDWSQLKADLACARLCTPCSRILDRPRLVKPSLLKATASTCELCELLGQRLEQSGVGGDQEVEISRAASTLKIKDESRAILRICSLPGRCMSPQASGSKTGGGQADSISRPGSSFRGHPNGAAQAV